MIRTQNKRTKAKGPYFASHPPYAFGEEARMQAKHDADSHRSIRYRRTVGTTSVAVHHIFKTDDHRKVTLYIMQGLTGRGFFSKVEVRDRNGKRAGSYITLRPDYNSVDLPPSAEESEVFGTDYRAISLSRLLTVLIEDVGIVPEDATLIAGKLSAALEYELGKL